MSFKKIRGIKIPYRMQGLIYFTLLNYDTQPEAVRRRIDALFSAAAKRDGPTDRALREWMLRENVSAEKAAQKSYLSAGALFRCRKWIYENW